MSDPLEELLAAEAASRERIEAQRRRFDSQLREARIDAARIRERNEHRTRAAVERMENDCVAQTMREIDQLEAQTQRQLRFDESDIERKLDAMVDSRLKRFWPE